MAAGFSLTPVPGGRRRIVRALGFGLLNLGLAGERQAKSHAPVHGGQRSFDPDFRPIGGTLRRSIHTVAYVDGQEIGRDVDPEAEVKALPDYVPGDGAIVFIGTNIDYGLWVHSGTSKMEARPFLEEGLADLRGHEGELVSAGSQRALTTGRA